MRSVIKTDSRRLDMNDASEWSKIVRELLVLQYEIKERIEHFFLILTLRKNVQRVQKRDKNGYMCKK